MRQLCAFYGGLYIRLQKGAKAGVYWVQWWGKVIVWRQNEKGKWEDGNMEVGFCYLLSSDFF
jgi:hypothetical protein